jgi:hypothetical protein
MNDYINGIFEFVGGLMILTNCLRLYRDKCVKGWNISVTGFFASWGLWNLWYYPCLHQWASFVGGLLIAVANLVWIGMAIYYTRRIPQIGS